MQVIAGLLSLAALAWLVVGLIKPVLVASTPITRWATSRWRIAWAGIVVLIISGALIPETPEQLAARQAAGVRADSAATARDAASILRDSLEAQAEAEADSMAQVAAAKEAKFGPAPLISAWNGSSHDVERFLEASARDPDSIETEGCTEPITSDVAAAVLGNDYPDGWVVTCTWRGRNGFGGLNVARNSFILREQGGLKNVVWTDAG